MRVSLVVIVAAVVYVCVCDLHHVSEREEVEEDERGGEKSSLSVRPPVWCTITHRCRVVVVEGEPRLT